MRCRVLWLAVLAGVLSCAMSLRAAGATGPGAEAFDRGLDAFRSQNPAAALQLFLQARRAGLDTPALRYNLGAAYYGLQRYPEAEQEFQQLARDPAWAALAHYNLGLTAQRMGRLSQAAEHFRQAHRRTDDGNLRALSATALERLGRAPQPPGRTSAVASLAAGYDSNATLSPNAEAVGVSDQDGLFLEGVAAASHLLSGTLSRGLYGHGGLHVRSYADLDGFDQLGLRAGLSQEIDAGRWQGGFGGYFDWIQADGERLQQAVSVDMRARRRLEAGRDVGLRYQGSRIEGGAAFAYLTGWEQRLSAEARFGVRAARWRAGYELELNDRADLEQAGEFLSYSPTRHSIFASVAWPLGAWQAQARGEYRASRFNDPHRLDGGATRITRADERHGIALRASRPVAASWQALIDYSYYRNRSNLDAYDYDRHQLSIGIEAVF